MQFTRYRIAIALLCISALPVSAQVLSFEGVLGPFELEFVEIGGPGNRPDDDPRLPEPVGSVDYVYSIAKYEVACSAVAAAILQDTLPARVPLVCPYPSLPFKNGMSDAVHFVNFLNESSGYEPAYRNETFTFEEWDTSSSGYDPNNPIRNKGSISTAKLLVPRKSFG